MKVTGTVGVGVLGASGVVSGGAAGTCGVGFTGVSVGTGVWCMY